MKLTITDPGTLMPIVIDTEIDSAMAETIMDLVNHFADGWTSGDNSIPMLSTKDLQIIRGVLSALNSADIDGGLMQDELDLLRRVEQELTRREVIDR